LDVIKNADHIIDLGPGAGDSGGYVIATGTPEEIARQPIQRPDNIWLASWKETKAVV